MLRQRGQGGLHRFHLCELRVPAPLKLRRHQTMPRIDLVILLKGAPGFILELRQLMLQGVALPVLTLLDSIGIPILRLALRPGDTRARWGREGSMVWAANGVDTVG